MSVCGIDIGTTGCKVAVYSLDGRRLFIKYVEYSSLSPCRGWRELDAGHIWKLVCQIINQASESCSYDPIEAVSVSSFGEAVVSVDNDRNVLYRSILCSDIRGQEYIDELFSNITLQDFYKINPNIPGVAYTMPKLKWIKENKPGIFDRSDYFLPWADFICFMLGAEPFVCRSLACRTLLYDINNSTWSDQLIDISGLSDIRDKLPPVISAGQMVGEVSSSLSKELGLKKHVKIVSGGHDQCCNAFGAGVNRKGQAVYGIGTFACITPVFDNLPDSSAMLSSGLCIENHVIDTKYVTFIYNQAGSLIKWFRDTFAAAETLQYENIYDRLNKEILSSPTEIFTIPYFEPTGPPFYITDAGGLIFGLNINTKRGEILKSIMESSTFYLLDASKVLKNIGEDIREFVVTGGGAVSDIWVQIKADIWGKPFIRKSTLECSVLGAAMIAGIGCDLDLQPDLFIRNEVIFEPDKEKNLTYQEKFIKYQEIVKKMLK